MALSLALRPDRPSTATLALCMQQPSDLTSPSCLRLVGAAQAGLHGPDRNQWLAQLRDASDDLRTTVTRCLDSMTDGSDPAGTGDQSPTGTALSLVASLWWGWFQLGRIAEARTWLDAALAHPAPIPVRPVDASGRVAATGGTAARIEALLGSGWLAFLAGESSVATVRLAAAVNDARTDRSWRQLALGLGMLSQATLARGDHARAERLASESVELGRLAGDPWALAFGLACLGDASRLRGERLGRGDDAHHVRVTGCYARGLEAARLAGDPWLIALSLANLAEHGWAPAAGTVPPGALMAECLALSRTTGERWLIARGLMALATLTARGGEHERTAPLVAAAAALADAAGTMLTELRRRASPASPPTPVPRPVSPRSASASDSSAPAGDGALHVAAFGPGRITVDGRLVDPDEWGYAKPREMLFYLLEHPRATKDEIGAALWPHANRPQVRGSFHVALHHLRRILGDRDWVIYAGGRYSLRRTPQVWYDVATVEAHLAAAAAPDRAAEAIAQLEAAVLLAAGDYLENVPGAWVVARRNELRWRLHDALTSLADLLLAAGRDDDAAAVRYRLTAKSPRRAGAAQGSVRLAHTIRVTNGRNRAGETTGPPRPESDRIARLVSGATTAESDPPQPRADSWRQRGTA